MNVTDITSIVLAILGVIVAIASTVGISCIKKYFSEDQLEKIDSYVKIFVSAAEQLYEKTEGPEKKEWVLGRIVKKLDELGITIDLAEIEAYIEAAVLKLHDELYNK